MSGLTTADMTVVLPAHNEAHGITHAIRSVHAQHTGRILVVADNCSDDTASVARAAGADVMETVGNTHRKAGALNQALARVLDDPTVERVLCMDADTTLGPAFIETAHAVLDDQPSVAAVGAVFHAPPATSWLEQCQANEWRRFSLEVSRTGRVQVLSGTAAMIRTDALRAVRDARGTTLPGRRGDVYDTAAIAEDSELTLALKTLGYRVSSPQSCTVTTEVMPTWGDLRRQRVRWYRGMLENLAAYGVTRTTASYWWQQAGLALGTAAFWAYLVATAVLAAIGGLSLNPFWVGVGAIFLIERVVTARHGGRILAALMIPEMVYAAALQWYWVAAVTEKIRHRAPQWHHLTQEAAA